MTTKFKTPHFSAPLAALTAATLSISFFANAQVPSQTFAGTAVPKAVQELVEKAVKNGAVVYDVNETNSEGELIYSPYSSSAQASGIMAFDRTEITPEKLIEDMNFKGQSQWMSGYMDAPTSNGQTMKVATYKSRFGGTGRIAAVYDEAYHTIYFARGPQGQKWANNCGILEDGSFHCLPAVRRAETSDYILTNPDLARGKKMMYNGHVDVENGVIVGIEVSGKIAKRIGSGKIKMIDPIAFFKAWGFQVSPDITIAYGNTKNGVPVRNEELGLVTKP